MESTNLFIFTKLLDLLFCLRLRFEFKLDFLSLILTIAILKIYIALVNWWTHSINTEIKLTHFLKEILILIFWKMLLLSSLFSFLIIVFYILMKALSIIGKTRRLENEIGSFRNISDSSSTFLIFWRFEIWIKNFMIRIQCRDWI